MSKPRLPAHIKALPNPDHAPGCYVMYFYCKYENPDHPWQSHGGPYMEEADQVETRTAAIRQAREAGWIYHSDGTSTCPRCAKAIRDARNEAMRERRRAQQRRRS